MTPNDTLKTYKKKKTLNSFIRIKYRKYPNRTAPPPGDQRKLFY